MRKILLVSTLLLASVVVFGQAKKPELMIIPAKSWCNTNKAMQQFDNEGTIEVFCDYDVALLNTDLKNVISKINILMADRGFPLIDLSAQMQGIKNEQVENSLVESKSGSGLAESMLDVVLKRAKADIILEIDWQVNTMGPKKSITYNLRALDSYTYKQIAGAQGTGSSSFSAEIPVLLEEAVLEHMDSFTNQLQNHFDDLFANGREIAVNIHVFDNGDGVDLDTEYNGEELKYSIEDWMENNAVKGKFNVATATETRMQLTSVRIPLFNENGRAMDARAFGRQLDKFLKSKPYSLKTKLITKGLGVVDIYIGNE
ncbi:hypothetical protein HX004_06490 [Myroides sp. 1354]|uniref:DUF6175 family protein n=1 Tax=unclassified Myroides TaxID=2642485 RepID=UPI002576AA80|nr:MULTISPECIES: DUF6175 family protein [unclassified Myroides]MDM1044710.1 hypothetical protein [Myroides sp. R163-1]MDM1055423.1 hypothetical protein [Myroides sp. 1354]MDM1068720.1 hypothetical protein [Myroides sp. 1372]